MWFSFHIRDSSTLFSSERQNTKSDDGKLALSWNSRNWNVSTAAHFLDFLPRWLHDEFKKFWGAYCTSFSTTNRITAIVSSQNVKGNSLLRQKCWCQSRCLKLLSWVYLKWWFSPQNVPFFFRNRIGKVLLEYVQHNEELTVYVQVQTKVFLRMEFGLTHFLFVWNPLV